MTTPRPLPAFNFLVETVIYKGMWLCRAGFSECDGLEVQLEPHTIREGGYLSRPIHLPGKLSYGRLTLRRGMSESGELWNWFEAAVASVALTKSRLRADTMVTVESADHSSAVRFLLTNCTPVRIKAPALNAGQGAVAIEELQLAYELLFRVPL